MPERSEQAIIRALSIRADNRYDNIDDFRRDIEAQGQDSRHHASPAQPALKIQREDFRIFLCHSSRDKAAVRRLYRRLGSDGLYPWFDEEELIPGQDWESEIKKAVRKANLIIVCLSRDSGDQRGYVHREIKLALDVAAEQPWDAIYLIPARLDNVDLPEDLRRWQWVDLFEDRGYEKLMKAINEKASRS